MGVDASQLFVAGDGRVYRGAVNAAFPTLVTTDPLETVWADLGYATVEGVMLNVEPEYADVFAWQSLRYIRRIKSTVAESLSMTFMQWTRGTVLTAFGGGTFTEPTPGDYYYNPPLPADRDEFAMIVDVDDGSERMRWCFRKVQNTSSIETQFSRESEANLPVTVDVLDPGSGLSPWFFRTNATRFEDYGS